MIDGEVFALVTYTADDRHFRIIRHNGDLR